MKRWVREWWITLRVLRNPLSREILLGPSGDDDYVEVRRPGKDDDA